MITILSHHFTGYLCPWAAESPCPWGSSHNSFMDNVSLNYTERYIDIFFQDGCVPTTPVFCSCTLQCSLRESWECHWNESGKISVSLVSRRLSLSTCIHRNQSISEFQYIFYSFVGTLLSGGAGTPISKHVLFYFGVWFQVCCILLLFFFFLPLFS